ncbi:site-specific DNA-methyltransferase [Methylobacillus gramineus]|uniref:site-specific DNA-methyltransferase n=1 Tax=Methylobacillus gramineus TaxID=755169 RepID=UPI001CFFCFAB|nr:site-specific DNA-methyltransferase [Methylobacillus gramineus]MCB5183976.1 site-specific DNA-methyltransferase [Methylobacillus gramineus]
MATLHWGGKNKVVNHHHDVPFRLLDKQYSFKANEGAPANSTNNRIIHGDNLEALKSLLPEFEGKVNCIYIDPPYNTGNEGWVYNDNVNDPKIKKWLGQVVGKEGEDLSRHDKWLCMMYPRLKLLHRLLADEGVILVSLDDVEAGNFRLLMDEVFGYGNRVATIVWNTRNTDNRIKSYLSQDHENIFVYGKSASTRIEGRVINRSDFKNPDNDPRGPYVTDPLKGKATASERPNLHSYNMEQPNTNNVWRPDPAKGWITDFTGYEKLLEEDRIWWPPNPETGWPRKKRFLSEVQERMPASTFWSEFKTQSGARELDEILDERVFAFPKPISLVQRIISYCAPPNSIVMDSFAGSGTTAHAVLKQNAEDGGNRRFILCEMMDYAETITAERVRRVINGYGEGSKGVAGLGGGFDFYTVGTALFKEDKNLNEEVGAEAIRGYVAYTENIPTEKRLDAENSISPYVLGLTNTALCVFYYEKDRVTTLDIDFLGQLRIKNLSSRPEQFVIYADKCALDKDFLYKHGITFKRIPRDITRF